MFFHWSTSVGTRQRPLRILIMGAGSLGSVVGGFMAKGGHEVVLVGRAPHMNAIGARGLQITGIWGDHLVDTLRVQTDLSGLGAGDFDLIVITVKSYDTGAAIEAVKPLVDGDTLVCSYQNGLGNAERIAECVGWERTFGARAIYGVWLPEEGHAEVTVIADATALGTYDDSTPSSRVREIARAMDGAGLPTVYTENIASVLWSKVAYNCALNPMSALLDVRYGALAESEDTRAIIGEVIRELYATGEAMKVVLDPSSAAEYLELFFEILIPPTAEHYASMREDFRRKRRTEIEALNGAICRYGAELGIACPVNSTLSRLVRARESHYLES